MVGGRLLIVSRWAGGRRLLAKSKGHDGRTDGRTHRLRSKRNRWGSTPMGGKEIPVNLEDLREIQEIKHNSGTTSKFRGNCGHLRDI